MVTWILERDVFATKTFDEMVAAIEDQGHTLHVVRVKPFVHEIEGKVPVTPAEGESIVVYGSIGVQKLANEHGWRPGVWTSPDFNESALKRELGGLYLNHDVSVTRFRNVMQMNRLSGDFFIKPNTDTKEFAGFVTDKDGFREWYEKQLDTGYIDDSILDLEVAVSAAKKVGCEWRLLIVEGKVADYSIYRQWKSVMPTHECPAEVVQFAEIAARRWSPAPVFGLDVCESEDGYSVIEYNAFNSMGLYAMDIPTVIEAVSTYAGKNPPWIM